jgi:capsular polysaccharide biosynthesis protein
MCLRLYPASFRQRFGPEMLLQFEDEWREAAGRKWRWRFWARMAFDLACSVPRQHLLSLQEKTMKKSLLAQPVSFTRLFIVTAVVILSAIVFTTLFIVPKTYMNLARVEIVRHDSSQGYDPYLIQTAMERLKSRSVLETVVTELGLARIFGQERGGAPMSKEEAYQYLLGSLQLRQSRSTGLVEIGVYSHENRMGAGIANHIAQVFSATKHPNYDVLVVDSAVPAARPIRPNVPINIALGTLLSALAAAAVAGLSKLYFRPAQAV